VPADLEAEAQRLLDWAHGDWAPTGRGEKAKSEDIGQRTGGFHSEDGFHQEKNLISGDFTKKTRDFW
jgi:hypothetical protein